MHPETAFFHDDKRNHVKSLDDYYFIGGATDVTATDKLTRIPLSDRAKEQDRRRRRKIIAALILVAFAEATECAADFISVRVASYLFVSSTPLCRVPGRRK